MHPQIKEVEHRKLLWPPGLNLVLFSNLRLSHHSLDNPSFSIYSALVFGGGVALGSLGCMVKEFLLLKLTINAPMEPAQLYPFGYPDYHSRNTPLLYGKRALLLGVWVRSNRGRGGGVR